MLSTYPDEWPGAGLLLLRAAIGAVLIARGASCLLGWHELKFAPTAIVLMAVVGATLLLAGYLTRIGGILVTLATICGISFWFSAPTISFFQSRLAATLLGIIATALVCLGPGAFSLDARLFGRQEIVFPQTRSEN